MQRRVLVAGGAGFLGSHLCEALLARGDTVTAVDDLSTGRMENIASIVEHPRFHLVEADVTSPGVFTGEVDAAAHLAGAASPVDYQRSPIETMRVGSVGTELLLQIAEEHGARFVLASTSEVYGDPLVHPQREDYRGNVDPTGPRSVYDEAKRYAEALVAAYRRTRGVDAGIVRIFNTYGPRMRAVDGRVISTFITQALNGEPLTVFGDGSHTRSFCYVDDLVRGLLAMIDCSAAGPVNLGRPDERSIDGVAELVVGLVGSGSPIEHRPLPQDDPARRKPDIRLARELLGWVPTTPLDVGLTRTVDWFRTRQDEVRAARRSGEAGIRRNTAGVTHPPEGSEAA